MGTIAQNLGLAGLGSMGIILGLASESWAVLAIQPSNKHSTLVANSGDDVRDTDFAAIMKDLLIDSNGNSTVKDAKFFFQTCYGGGMLDDLVTALGTIVKWVGGSASRYDEVSWGYTDKVSGAGDFWTLGLVPELAKNQTIKQAIDKADLNPWEKGTNVTETGQSIYGLADGSQNIKLKDPQTKSFHAILWAGIPDGDRHFNDILRMQDVLTNQMLNHVGASKFSITTLFGNGSTDKHGNALPFTAQAATKANLQAAVNSLKSVLGPDEQFFFYASDHGGFIEEPVKPVQPVTVPTGGTQQLKIQLTEQEKTTILEYIPATPVIVFEFSFKDLPPAQTASVQVMICFPDEPGKAPIYFADLQQTGQITDDGLVVTLPGAIMVGPGGGAQPGVIPAKNQSFSLLPFISLIDLDQPDILHR